MAISETKLRNNIEILEQLVKVSIGVNESLTAGLPASCAVYDVSQSLALSSAVSWTSRVCPWLYADEKHRPPTWSEGLLLRSIGLGKWQLPDWKIGQYHFPLLVTFHVSSRK